MPDGRCHRCGYALSGLPAQGTCPECGTSYTPETSARLRPWPGPLAICCRLGWPIAGLVGAGSIIAAGNYAMGDLGEVLAATGLVVGYAMVVAVAINSYFQVRSMLKRSLPEAIRTRGPVAILRKIGTTLCVTILVLFVGGPFVFGVACLIVLSTS